MLQRRAVLVAAVITMLGIFAYVGRGRMAPPTAPETSSAALEQLLAGNKRYVEARLTHPNQDAACRARTAKAQRPFAVILGCSDSRVPPEVIFDQGQGDLFVIRVAGNIAEPAVLGSIEYAVEHLDVPLVMVLGHARCGAVDATLKGGTPPGHLSALVNAIQPAVDEVKGKPGDPLDAAVRANVRLVVKQLNSSEPILAEMVKNGKLEIVGARYDLDSGKLDLVR